MRLFGIEIRRAAKGRTKAASDTAGISTINDGRGWWPIFESFTGAWQQDVVASRDTVLAQSTVFACVTLIASDIGKLRIKLTERSAAGIWEEIASPAFSPVLRKPNDFQITQRFVEAWITSKLSNGNTYVLKARDARGVVVELYVLDPWRVIPLVTPRGDVYYSLGVDYLAKIPESMIAVPASEIIHDRANCLFHPLVGISPIFACALAATQGLNIQMNSAKFFKNMSRPSGLLTAPEQISDETAARLKREFEQNYSGEKIGRVAVLGDGLKYESMAVNAVDAQMAEQLKLSAEQVCSVFHVPPYMVGAAAPPAYNNIEALNQQYYSQCLQTHIESLEANLDDGLGLSTTMGTELCLEGLLRMDSATQIEVLAKAVSSAIMSPDEARAARNLPPVAGGATPYLQQQNYSLAALDKRDTGADPFGKAKPPAPAPAAGAAANDPTIDSAAARALGGMLRMKLLEREGTTT